MKQLRNRAQGIVDACRAGPGDREHHAEAVRRTPFHEHTAACNERQQWQVRGAYLTAGRYSDPELEHAALRNAVTVSDVSWLVKYRLEGPHAQRLLERLLTGQVASLAVGRARHALLCDGDGKLRDQAMLFRLDQHSWRLTLNHRQLDWLTLSARGLDEVSVCDETDQVAAVAVAGPRSASALRAAGLEGVQQLSPGESGQFVLGAEPVYVSRTGAAGELAYELWAPWDQAQGLWPALAAVPEHGLTPIGSDALALACLEAGRVREDFEYRPAHLSLDASAACTPLELGLRSLVALDRAGFNGRRALLAQHRSRRHRRLVPALVEGGTPPRPGTPVTNYRNRQVGTVTSAAWSPAIKQNLAWVLLDAGVDGPDDALRTEVEFEDGLRSRRRRVSLRLHRWPFHDPVSRRITPAGRY